MNAKHRLATAFLLVGALTASSLGASQVNSKEHQCTKHDFKCTAAEGKCTGDFMTKEALCYNVSTGERTGSCCQFPYHCYNGKCLLSNENYDCKDDNECFSSYYGTRLLACVSERCVPKYNAGDKCSGDDSCYGEMVCEKDTCKGIAEGGECIGPVKIRTGSLSKVSGFECAHNLYCLNATCVKSAATGETCNANPDSDNYKPCEESLTCNNEVCTKRYSIQLGSSCTTDDACVLGLACINKTCSKSTGYHFIQCDSDSDCKVDGVQGICSECDYHTGYRRCDFGESADCIKNYNSYYNCIQKYGCADVISTDSKTCAYSKCSGQIKAILGCKMNCKHYRDVYGNCASYKLIGYCPSMERWAQTLLAFAILIVVLAIVCLCYTLIDKFSSHEYKEIPDVPSH